VATTRLNDSKSRLSLLQQFGLIPFLTNIDNGNNEKEYIGIVLIAGLGGIFVDNMMDRFRNVFVSSENQSQALSQELNSKEIVAK
jgi:hypothetical protein